MQYLLIYKYIMNNSEALVRWLFAKPDRINWLEIKVPFDTSTWAEEANRINPYYVTHRGAEEHDGWSSCCLHGLGIDKTNGYEFYQTEDTGYDWTELAQLTPTITNFWKTFPAESYKRIRFMKLAAGGRISLHRDCEPEDLVGFDPFEHDFALNLAVVHPEECTMTVAGATVPWKTGMSILLNVSKDHEVINNSNHDRIHMIAHFRVGNRKDEFCELISRSRN
jgi:hypothetical protein